MAIASTNSSLSSDQTAVRRKSAKRSTAHLKVVPETLALRERIKAECVRVAAQLDKSRPLTKDEMESLARKILEHLGLPEGYVGWTMVILASEFWRDQVAAVPPSRRLFLLPHCLKHAEGCPADYDEFGLDCKRCGACSIADFRTAAEQMGYKVLVAEGSPIVLKIIVSGYVDAIIGVACLNVLEKAIDKILLAGIPCMAVPLLSSDCRNTSVDEPWVHEMIQVRQPAAAQATRTYLHLLRGAAELFTPEVLESLAPRLRGGPRLSQVNGQGLGALDPIAATEAVAYDFLCKGGKYSRPFITLAVYDALQGDRCTLADGADHVKNLPDYVKRTALSIEVFHKASLVHDDIEDDDAYRYGEPTLHQRYGIPTAINVGDYLIGMGYRLISHQAPQLGGDVAADILNCLADAHLRLSEGQGAELLWRDAQQKYLTPLDALKIYALKTAPAFEAALYCGARLAGDASNYQQPIKQFARNLGVAFQILNDLKDWQPDRQNKLLSGGDVLGRRPTLLWALALEALPDADRQRLIQDARSEELPPPEKLTRIRHWYQKADVFEKAHRLVDKHQERAEAVADEIQPDSLRRLWYYLIDTVLSREGTVASDEPAPAVVPLAPVVSPAVSSP
ncbi:MAG: polyprenyl synthetase [Pirellulaceae bacterium]|nr:MAG: polyprenyl synthetase [Pirellulaceae bacterium]